MEKIRLIIILSGVFLFGCVENKDYSNELSGLVSQYTEVPSVDLVKRIKQIISEIEIERSTPGGSSGNFMGNMSELEEAAVKPIVKTLISEKEYDLAFDVYGHVGFDTVEYKLLHDTYEGNSPYINLVIAEGLVASVEIKSAFLRVSQAAMTDYSYAKYVRGLLQHYGCRETDMIWAELYGDGITSHRLAVGGEKYETLSVSDSFKKSIPVLRRNIRLGNMPDLQENCPIHLYL